MPLLPATRGVGRRLSGRELRPFLLDSPRFEQGASMADPAGTRPPLISLSRRPFMAAIAGGLLGAPLAARAQSAGKVYRIALIFVCSRVSDMAGPGDAAQALHLLGDIATHPDRFDAERGETHYRQALALAEPRGMRPLVAHCHLGLGRLYRRTDKGEQAQEHLTTATTMFREMDMRFYLEQAEAEMGA